MEDMKERYYSIINILNASRKVQAPQLYYDAESERRRKEQLLKLWERTDDQVFTKISDWFFDLVDIR
jgi:hypothetical protein